MILYVLQKLGVPGAVHLVAVAPVEHELRHLALGKRQVDIGQFEHVVHILTGLPVLRDAPRLGIVLKSGIIPEPLAFDVLDELAVPGAPHIAPLLPVKHELGNGVLDERQADIGVLYQHFQRIPAWPPAAVHGDLPVAADLVLGLGFAPLAQQMFEELGSPGVVAFTALAPVGNEFRQLLAHKVVRDVVLGNVPHQLGIRSPVGADPVGACLRVRTVGGGGGRGAWGLVGFVEGKQQLAALGVGRGLDQDDPFVPQTFAHPLQVLIAPEWQQRLQLRRLELEPVVPLPISARPVVGNIAEGAEQNRFFQANGGGQ